MGYFRFTIRFIAIVLHLLLGLVLTAIVAGLFRWDIQNPHYKALVQWWLNQIVKIIGGRITIQGKPLAQGCLMVANHISWLDIPVLGGCHPVRFLSKSDVKHWPVIGWLARCSGTLFIERGKQSAANNAASEVSGSLQNGDSVLVFPEATTSDGLSIRPFHARLFSSAQTAMVPIQPIAIRYFTPQGKPHPLVPFIDEQSLFYNLRQILTGSFINIEIHFLKAIPVSAQHPRKELAADSERQIREVVETPKLAAQIVLDQS